MDCCEPSSDSEVIDFEIRVKHFLTEFHRLGYILINALMQMSDNEIELAVPDARRKTIVDQFHEAFGDTFSNENMRSNHNVSKALRSVVFTVINTIEKDKIGARITLGA